MQKYFYAGGLNGEATKPLDIYRGTEKIGVVQGHYENIFKRFFGEIISSRDFIPTFLKHELKDDSGNVRLLAKSAGFFKNGIAVTYFECNGNKYEFVTGNMKKVRFGQNKLDFKYKGNDFLIKNEPLMSLSSKPTEMYLGEKLIADWKIYFTMISRLITKDAGVITIDGEDITKSKNNDLAKKISILKQSHSISLKLAVRELVSFGRFPYSQGKLMKEGWEKFDEAIACMELEELEGKFLDELSGGQRQRAHIAMVIAQDTEYVLLD